ncbi:hypothetical protein BDA96_04G196500 [Sorghum bicolor]|uniref:Nucleoside diphosphate kinase n=1 Tax=Sorghum bicolor TaxID=4558 RepID=A0A921R6H8_SORBI|nr:hypothetical protein BDA96_04G196500 [Sorghum bicolor]
MGQAGQHRERRASTAGENGTSSAGWSCVGWLSKASRPGKRTAGSLSPPFPAPPRMAGATTSAPGALVRVCLPPLLLLFLFYGCCRCGAVEAERTLAMIKPDGLSGKYTEKIKAAILDSGFHIVKETKVQLDAERASLFYAEHSQRSFFDSLVKYITSGPVLAMVLERPDAIAQWRALIGPTDARKAKTSHPNSIRAMCGLDSEKNCVHGSDSPESAAREISFFFGEEADSVTVEHDEL